MKKPFQQQRTIDVQKRFSRSLIPPFQASTNSHVGRVHIVNLAHKK